MSGPSDRRLALDILQLVHWRGQAAPASCRHLRADEGLARWLDALGPADDGISDAYAASWDGLRLHVRRAAIKMGVLEAEAVRRLIPSWRAQGLLLAAVEVAAERELRAANTSGEADAGGAIDSHSLGDQEAWVGPSEAELAADDGFGGWGP